MTVQKGGFLTDTSFISAWHVNTLSAIQFLPYSSSGKSNLFIFCRTIPAISFLSSDVPSDELSSSSMVTDNCKDDEKVLQDDENGNRKI